MQWARKKKNAATVIYFTSSRSELADLGPCWILWIQHGSFLGPLAAKRIRGFNGSADLTWPCAFPDQSARHFLESARNFMGSVSWRVQIHGSVFKNEHNGFIGSGRSVGFNRWRIHWICSPCGSMTCSPAHHPSCMKHHQKPNFFCLTNITQEFLYD